ncbi:hypothetical protein OG395_43080 [Streptomyces sp. NBC_01320]|nr:hypothetical protein OG395_43080 [Streptomyces sp. NBC_01320]
MSPMPLMRKEPRDIGFHHLATEVHHAVAYGDLHRGPQDDSGAEARRDAEADHGFRSLCSAEGRLAQRREIGVIPSANRDGNAATRTTGMFDAARDCWDEWRTPCRWSTGTCPA